MGDLKKYGAGCKDCAVPIGLHADRVAIERETLLAYTAPPGEQRPACSEERCPFQCAGCCGEE